MRAAESRSYWPVLLVSVLMLPVRGLLAYFLAGWLGVVPVQGVAAPGLVARSLNGTGRINLGQGAVITVQGVGGSLSPALGGWIAQLIGYGPAFPVLGALGLISAAVWVVFATEMKKY